MYKKGTYKLNLGISPELKNQLDCICLENSLPKLADGVRFAIEFSFSMINKPASDEYVLQCLQETRKLLQDSLLSLDKMKIVIKE